MNIEGQKFGRLFVEKFVGISNTRQSLWQCKCDCGKITTVRGKHLRNGQIVSCGCYRLQRVTETFFKNLTDKKFGRLTVIEVDKNKNGCYYWKCKCNCGNIVSVAGNKLSIGHTRSCGCLCRDICSQKMKEVCKKQKGKNHPRWNPNITDEERNRKQKEFKASKWRMKVYTRDKFTCQKCKDNRGGNLNSHHIYSWMDHLKLRYVVNNGITLCKDCHKKFHGKYGYGKNTQKQFTEYLHTL